MLQCLDWHYDTHLGINNKKEEIGCIKPYQNRKKKQVKRCFHWSRSGWGNEEPGNFTHIILLPRNYYLLTHFGTSSLNFEDRTIFFYTLLVVSTVSMTSTISTQPTSNYFHYLQTTQHLVCHIAAYLSNMYRPLPLTKVPPGHHASACPIPLIKITTPTLFSIFHDIGVHWADPMIKLILAVCDSSFVQPLIVLLHLPFPILCHFCHFFPFLPFTIKKDQKIYYLHT